MSDIQQWLKDHDPQWKNRQPRPEQNFVPRPLFGEEDADTEWQHNENPQQIFAHIASYDEFSAHAVLFLFGRRGSGKTALLHMLTHDVNTGGRGSKNYSHAVLLKPVVADLLPILRGALLATLEDTDLLSLLRLAWHWLIISAAYIEIAQVSPEERAPSSDLADRFHGAIDSGRLSNETLADYLINELYLILKAVLQVNTAGPNQLALTIIELRQRLGSISTQPLEHAILASYHKTKRPTLVLVEAEEVYRLDDYFASAFRNALIDSILEIYNRFRQFGILAKAAFPSEIYPFIAPSNIEKIENKLIFILWGYRDLLILVAKRYYRILHSTLRQDKLEKELRSLEDFQHSKRFLNSVLPARIVSRNHIDLDTFSYIVRHTQKKPRQLIAIFNCVLTMASDANRNLGKLGDADDLIREAVHSRLDTLVLGALDIYKGIFTGAPGLVKKAMTGMQCYFSPSDLDKAITQTNEMRDQSVTREDVRQLLLQAGVIGLTRQVPTPIRKSESSASMMEALFEYQVKGRLVINNNSICVIHPMFYEELEIKIDTTVLAYPKPTAEEEQLLQHSYGSWR
jgi:hypothetical protein